MISELFTAIGLVFVIEGLILALAPGHLRGILELVAQLPPEQLRNSGLIAATIGVAIVWAARAWMT